MGCAVGHRRGLDLALLWLQCRLTAAAPIQPLDLELPYAMGVALKGRKEKKKTTKNEFIDLKTNLKITPQKLYTQE